MEEDFIKQWIEEKMWSEMWSVKEVFYFYIFFVFFALYHDVNLAFALKTVVCYAIKESAKRTSF